jgi:hypothetical protein
MLCFWLNHAFQRDSSNWQDIKIRNSKEVCEIVTKEHDEFCEPKIVYNIVCGPRTAVPRNDEAASLGSSVMYYKIVCGTRIGHNDFVGAAAIINRDVGPSDMMIGIPACQPGWMSACVECIGLQIIGSDS